MEWNGMKSNDVNRNEIKWDDMQRKENKIKRKEKMWNKMNCNEVIGDGMKKVK